MANGDRVPIRPCDDDTCEMEVGLPAPVCGAPAMVHYPAHEYWDDDGASRWADAEELASRCSLPPGHDGDHDATAPERWEWQPVATPDVRYGVSYNIRHRHRDPESWASWSMTGPVVSVPLAPPKVDTPPG